MHTSDGSIMTCFVGDLSMAITYILLMATNGRVAMTAKQLKAQQNTVKID